MTKYALIFAVENYHDLKFKKVRYANDDAIMIEITLQELGFKTELIKDNYATYKCLETKLNEYCDILEKDDEFIFYYSGHGFEFSGINIITTCDSEYSKLMGTGFQLQNIYLQLKDAKSKKILLFLDACHSGVLIEDNMRGGLSDFSTKMLEQINKKYEYILAFASSKHNEKSYSADEIKHGIWSYHLNKLLRCEYPNTLKEGRYLMAKDFQN